ncbi:MAG: hypothetical protein IKD69_06775, partial [Solobacterium sp.]|nr:hypothetical protein [Solobacterium sp.]
MNAFLYYCVHTFVNTLKKMFKSWVVLFIVGCMAVGMIVGFTIAMLTDHDEPAPEDEIVEVVPPEEMPEDIFDNNPVIEVAEDGDFFSQIFDVSEVKGSAAFEAGAAAIILLLFSISVLTADKTAETLFLPADANLLFSAPVKPQSVLLFRLLLQLGASVFSGLYLMFQLPRLMEIFNVGAAGMAITMLSLVLSMFWTKLIEVIMYMFTAGNARRKNLTRYCLYGILGALLLGSIAYLSAFGKLNLGGLINVFASPALRFVPVWGWIKAACGYAVTGNTMMAWACILLTFAATAVSIILIWRAKADFYEDAINRAEARAELMTQAAETGMVQRKKERKSSLLRDGFDYGHGASTFFFKAMYNRFRFSHLHFFTKTAETYLAISVLFTILFRFVLTDEWMHASANGDLHIVSLLGFGLLLMVFYRSIASTLPEDAKNDLFRMAPQRTWLKLFYSALADQLNCMSKSESLQPENTSRPTYPTLSGSDTFA